MKFVSTVAGVRSGLGSHVVNTSFPRIAFETLPTCTGAHAGTSKHPSRSTSSPPTAIVTASPRSGTIRTSRPTRSGPTVIACRRAAIPPHQPHTPHPRRLPYPAQHLEQPERRPPLPLVTGRPDRPPDARKSRLIIRSVRAPIPHLRPLPRMRVHDRQRPVPHDEEPLQRRRPCARPDQCHHRRREQPHRTNASTRRTSASAIRTRCIGTISAGSRSGSHQPSSSDSWLHASAPPTTRHSKLELT